jgi:glycosidase
MLALALLWLLLGAGRLQQSFTTPTPATSVVLGGWRGATCYEVFVRSFQDSNDDGIGDLRGLTQRLDYINDGDPRTVGDLGARCIWLMPIAESPGYHGYDVSDYYRVEPDYGTNDDFKAFVAAAHRRGIRVLVDMVPNHMSREHPFFQAALRDTTSPYRAYFRFAPRPGPDNKWGNNNWHKSPVRDEYYYAFFWQGMPDLNYERPEALAEMKRVASFWLTEMDVDGFRLDAVKYLVERGAQADDVPATHEVLRDFAAHVRAVKPQAITIGEVFDSTGVLLSYYPDQLDGYFAFELADSIISAVRSRSARGLLAPALRLQREVPDQRWSPFLRNHDQPRTLTALDGDTARAAVAATIMLTMPGLPFVYYGEEIGMTGPKPDELIRTPMAWTRSGPHAGFSRATPWQPLRPDSMDANVEVHSRTRGSLLQRHRRLIQRRDTDSALAAGRLIPLQTSHASVAAYVRREGAHVVLVLVNLDAEPARGVRLEAASGALPPGRYRPQSLLDGLETPVVWPSPLVADAEGRLRAHTVPTLRPMSAWVFRLERTGAGTP